MEVLKVAILAAVLCAVHGQDDALPRCSALRRDLFQRLGGVFRNVGDRAIGVCENLCVNRNGRVRRFYACCPGNTLVFVTGGRPNTSRPVDATNRLILCQLPRPTTPPPTTPPPPPPPTLSSCPSGPTRVNQYLRQHQDRLCEFRCSFRVASQGISLGNRSRTVYRCCNGEPKLESLSLQLYSCPEDNDINSTSSPNVQSTTDSPNVQSTTDSPNVQSTTDSPNVQSTTDSPNVQSTTDSPNVQATTDSPNVQATTDSPNVQSTTSPPPRATTSPPTPASSSCPSGPTRINQYLQQDRGLLCKRTCSFRVASQGISLGSRSRTIWRCCTGEPKIFSRALGLYRCP